MDLLLHAEIDHSKRKMFWGKIEWKNKIESENIIQNNSLIIENKIDLILMKNFHLIEI